MARYIDADKVLRKLPDDLPYKASVKRVLIQAPTADVAEVKHGKWKKEGCGLLVCSVCGFEYDHSGMADEGLNFCANCGAKMSKTNNNKEGERFESI